MTNKSYLVLTALGPDRPGLVNEISAMVLAAGANLEDSRMAILGGEFALFPKPPWFVTARSAATTGRLLSRFAAGPSWGKLPGIFVSAFRA